MKIIGLTRGTKHLERGQLSSIIRKINKKLIKPIGYN